MPGLNCNDDCSKTNSHYFHKLKKNKLGISDSLFTEWMPEDYPNCNLNQIFVCAYKCKKKNILFQIRPRDFVKSELTLLKDLAYEWMPKEM